MDILRNFEKLKFGKISGKYRKISCMKRNYGTEKTSLSARPGKYIRKVWDYEYYEKDIMRNMKRAPYAKNRLTLTLRGAGKSSHVDN
jgi:hypothetical protein